MKPIPTVVFLGIIVLEGCREWVPIDPRTAKHQGGTAMVLRTNAVLYRFSSHVVENDTLFGEAVILNQAGMPSGNFSGGIPVREILFEGSEAPDGGGMAYFAVWVMIFVVFGFVIMRQPTSRTHWPKHT